jgi:hypothetical protein
VLVEASRFVFRCRKEAPRLTGGAPSSGHERPRGVPYAFTTLEMPASGRPGSTFGVGCGARVACTTAKAHGYFQGMVRFLWITSQMSPTRRAPGTGSPVILPTGEQASMHTGSSPTV